MDHKRTKKISHHKGCEEKATRRKKNTDEKMNIIRLLLKGNEAYGFITT